MVEKMWLVLWTLCGVWVTVSAMDVQTPKEVLRAARGKSVTLPCSYSTTVPDRDGFIQWDKLLKTHTEKVFIWNFMKKQYIFGDLYTNRVSLSSNAENSDASITIDHLTMDDNGTYECSVSLMSDMEGTTQSRVRLLVLVPPSKPVCRIEGEVVIGNKIQLTCKSEEGSPAPQYSWKSYTIQHQERPLVPPVTGQTLFLKNISTEMSGYYICTSANDVGVESCNITVAVRLPSMNVALYAGIAGGIVGVLIIIGIIVYCCCCRNKSEDDNARPNRRIYQEPTQMNEISRGQEDDYGNAERD